MNDCHSNDAMKIYSQLINMGFDETLSMNAAQTYPNDLNKAINLASNDPLLLKESSRCQRMISTYGDNHPKKEYIVLSAKVIKINDKGNKQKRILLLTDKALYNLKPNKMSSCQRRIDYNLITSISMASNSNEFTIHVPTEHDYHYKINEESDKNRILPFLCKLCNIKIQITNTKPLVTEWSSFRCQRAMSQLNKNIVTPQIAESISLPEKHHTPETPKTLSKWTNSEDNLLVYGYIRRQASRIYKLKIPLQIMDCCLLHLSVMYESFDVENICDKDDFISISENKKILSVGQNHLLKQIVYGKYSVSCQRDNDAKTFMWKLRIKRMKNDGTIYIGIGNKDEKTIMYKAGKSEFRSCSIFKCNQKIGQMLHQFEKGDYIDIILDMVKYQLIFLINCDTQHIVQNIKCDSHKYYQLGVFLSYVQIELNDFNIFNGSWKEYKQSRNVNIEYKTKYFC